MQFTIKRDTWRCGGSLQDLTKECGAGDGPTSLLNEQGFMCCLGQIEEQLGVPREKLLNRAQPCGVNVANILAAATYDQGYFNNTDLATSAMGLNDNSMIRLAERELGLIKLFAKHGHELTFVGEYTQPKYTQPKP